MATAASIKSFDAWYDACEKPATIRTILFHSMANMYMVYEYVAHVNGVQLERIDRCRTLFDTIMKIVESNKSGYDTLIAALETTNQDHLIKLLKKVQSNAPIFTSELCIANIIECSGIEDEITPSRLDELIEELIKQKLVIRSELVDRTSKESVMALLKSMPVDNYVKIVRIFTSIGSEWADLCVRQLSRANYSVSSIMRLVNPSEKGV